MKILAIGDFHGKFSGKLKREVRKAIKEEKVDLIAALGDYTGLPEWRPIVLRQLREAKKGKKVSSGEEIIGKQKYKALLKKDFKAGLDVLRKLNRLGKPVFVLFGNGDWYSFSRRQIGKKYETYVKRMKNLRNINYSRTKFMSINFIGYGGYMDIDAYFNKKKWKDDENIEERIKRRKQAKKTLFANLTKAKGDKILVLHYTPKGTFDIIHGKDNPLNGKSAGVGLFNEAIAKFKPKLVLCGHMHEYQGKKMLGKSLVVNPGDAERGRFAVVDTEEKDIKVKFYR